jgi:hypothetical protein
MRRVDGANRFIAYSTSAGIATLKEGDFVIFFAVAEQPTLKPQDD